MLHWIVASRWAAALCGSLALTLGAQSAGAQGPVGATWALVTPEGTTIGAAGLEWRRIAERLRVEGPAQLYLIRNSKLSPRWEPVSPRVAPIVSRTISSLIRTQGIGDLAQTYLTAERASMGFNLARVPADFDLEPDELFDPEYMRALFERGFAAGRDEASWIRQGH
jgi:hypothetical protein